MQGPESRRFEDHLQRNTCVQQFDEPGRTQSLGLQHCTVATADDPRVLGQPVRCDVLAGAVLPVRPEGVRVCRDVGGFRQQQFLVGVPAYDSARTAPVHLDQCPAGRAREDIPPLNVHKILNGEPAADAETEQKTSVAPLGRGGQALRPDLPVGDFRRRIGGHWGGGGLQPGRRMLSELVQQECFGGPAQLAAAGSATVGGHVPAADEDEPFDGALVKDHRGFEREALGLDPGDQPCEWRHDHVWAVGSRCDGHESQRADDRSDAAPLGGRHRLHLRCVGQQAIRHSDLQAQGP